jgi:hypothetical protein
MSHSLWPKFPCEIAPFLEGFAPGGVPGVLGGGDVRGYGLHCACEQYTHPRGRHASTTDHHVDTHRLVGLRKPLVFLGFCCFSPRCPTSRGRGNARSRARREKNWRQRTYQPLGHYGVQMDGGYFAESPLDISFRHVRSRAALSGQASVGRAYKPSGHDGAWA